MPAPNQDIIINPQSDFVRIELQPAQNAFHSLVLLTRTEHYSGLGEWVSKTAAALTPAEKQTHNLVMLGLHYAVAPQKNWSSFPVYIDHLAQMNPFALRDKMLNEYISFPYCLPEDDQPVLETVDPQTILQNVDTYLSFLRGRFGAGMVDIEMETQAYSYAVNPTAMQLLIVSHLRHMWEKYLRSEWERVRPMLQNAVRAFQQIDYSQMSNQAAAEFIAGQPLGEKHWQHILETAVQILFVPSAHVGPYLGKFNQDTQPGIIFGARLPEGTQIDAPELSRAEIVVRLGALADDTRLRILKSIGETGEQRSQDVMYNLELSQSAASRHLKQLTANGYLNERRCEGAKCYQLHPERIRETLEAVTLYLTAK
ncbi:MAG: winged helix-turn-helix transcriptional regulator [Anaerolineales bacterium]|nr:winged helix-turn-helix transcriptional regulator [Anaerolineales bacterium]